MTEEPRPVLRVVGGGEPTAEELAALVVALTMRTSGAADPPPQRRSGWADRRAMQRRPMHPGPDAWRRSLR